MKVIAAIHADFEHGPLGTHSRLEEDLAGQTVIRRTIGRVLQASELASVHLVVHKSQESRAKAAIVGMEVAVETHEAAPVPWQSYVASARKWSLDAWRGGLGGTCVFDESLHPWVLEALAQRTGADGVVDVPAGAVLLDPAMLDAMIGHYQKVASEVRMTFTQSAPGLSAAVYAPALLGDLAKACQCPGRMMAYNPAEPRRDMIMLPCFYAPETDVRRAVGRCIADTGDGLARAAACLRECGDDDGPGAAAVSRWLLERWCAYVADLPSEVEIELTTQDPLADTTFRPRGSAVDRGGQMDTAAFDRLIGELAGRDDVRVVLGGFGDPLLHPEFGRCVRRCREAGVFGVAVRTTAVTLDEPAIEALMDARVDVINVLVDAATADTYRKVHRADYFDRVTANIDKLLDTHRRRQQPQPLVVCEMAKTHETMDELEPFYDRWMSRTGSAVIVGPSDYAGQWPDRAVMDMAPPTRRACERLFTRAMVLADGRMTVCDQDYLGKHAVGSVGEQSLSALWRGEAMAAVRRSHQAGTCDGMPLCRTCREWHRP
jgi:hypothetical protein